MSRDLPCGCRTCGCLCAEHSPDRTEQLCPRHLTQAISRTIAEEAAALVALSLFIGAVLAWCSILAATSG